MCVDGLKQTHSNPEVDGEDVEVAEQRAPEKRRADGSDTQKENLDWRCIFGGEAKGGSILVVNLMHASVERAPVERAM